MVTLSALGIYNGNIEIGLGTFVRRNLMCRLNINDKSNIIDGLNADEKNTTLEQNYPNPFNQSTQINYELATSSMVNIQVMDMTGRIVLSLKESDKPAGKHTVTINAADLEAGVYYYTLQAGSHRVTKQMVVY